MKRSIIVVLLVAALAAIPPQAKTEPPPQPWVVPAVRCIAVVIISAAGGVVIHHVKKWCDKVFSNKNYELTNNTEGFVSLPMLESSSSGDGTTTIQSATGIGNAWIDGYSFNVQQVNGTQIVAVATLNGVAVATNSAPVTGDGQTVVLDFRSLLPASTNAPAPSMVFRLVN